MTQYESGTRSPKVDMTNYIAGVLEIFPQALSIPDFDSEQGLFHTLFTLEDLYGIKIEQAENRISLTLDSSKRTTNKSVFGMLSAWQNKLRNTG